jgi:hypothetical protein
LALNFKPANGFYGYSNSFHDSIIVWPIDMENALKIWEVFEHIEGLKDNFPTVIA